MNYNSQFNDFLDTMSMYSGQTKLCEAIRSAYRVLCESDEDDTDDTDVELGPDEDDTDVELGPREYTDKVRGGGIGNLREYDPDRLNHLPGMSNIPHPEKPTYCDGTHHIDYLRYQDNKIAEKLRQGRGKNNRTNGKLCNYTSGLHNDAKTKILPYAAKVYELLRNVALKYIHSRKRFPGDIADILTRTTQDQFDSKSKGIVTAIANALKSEHLKTLQTNNAVQMFNKLYSKFDESKDNRDIACKAYDDEFNRIDNEFRKSLSDVYHDNNDR